MTIRSIYICANPEHKPLIKELSSGYPLNGNLKKADACILYWKKGETIPAEWEDVRKKFRDKTQLYVVAPYGVEVVPMPEPPLSKPRTQFYWSYYDLWQALGALTA